MTPSPTPPSYWLMSGDVPTGPFSDHDLQAKLAAGEIDPAARVCAVGGNEWRPLSEALGADTSVPPTSEAAEPRRLTPVTITATPSASTLDALLGVAVIGAAILGVVWLISWWLTPLTPRQVVEKLNDANTYQDAEPWLTLNLRPAIKALERYFNVPGDPNDKDELTDDRPAPPEMGGHLVGFRHQCRDPATKQWEQLDGYYHLIESDGWKVDDMLITVYNHQPLEQPLSMARDYRVVLDGLAGAQPRAAGTGTSPKWPDPKYAGPLAYGFGKMLFSGGKGAVVVLLAAAAALGALVRKRSFGGK